MAKISRKDRIKGTIMGTLVGDALGVGPHWYYDLDEMKSIYGEWIDDYVEEKPGRYHGGLKPGENSQTGQQVIMLLESVVECGSYDEDDFIRRLDALLATLDGTSQAGHFTDSAIRSLWKSRNVGHDWSEAGSFEDTAEAAIRLPVLAALFVDNPKQAMEKMVTNTRLTHRDPFMVGQQVAFGLTVCALVNGINLGRAANVLSALQAPEGGHNLVDEEGKGPRIPANWAKSGGMSFDLPVDWLGGADKGFVPPSAFYGSLGMSRTAFMLANDPEVTIEPATAVCRVYGLSCTGGFLLPAVYYLAARYRRDFEMAVLTAINGGGHNLARAGLTGGLSGAQVGLSGIPERLIAGLADHERLLGLADRLADLVGND